MAEPQLIEKGRPKCMPCAMLQPFALPASELHAFTSALSATRHLIQVPRDKARNANFEHKHKCKLQQMGVGSKRHLEAIQDN